MFFLKRRSDAHVPAMPSAGEVLDAAVGAGRADPHVAEHLQLVGRVGIPFASAGVSMRTLPDGRRANPMTVSLVPSGVVPNADSGPACGISEVLRRSRPNHGEDSLKPVVPIAVDQ